jgi:hypothetical protein
MKKIYLITTLLFINYCTQAQQRTCGTMAVHEHQLQQHPEYAQQLQAIEAYTDDYIANNTKATRNIYTIPVVVHILHYGEQIGQGYNISVQQINSQIEALNEDFSLANTDKLANGHPWASLQANTQIQFCLAQKDPSGNPTTGIRRYLLPNNNTVSDADLDNNYKLNTLWDNKKYLNIWVCNLSGGILGYAQFPGMGNSTDGVVILTKAFGYVGNVQAPYNNGRTAVHEVGHYLNLRHIWGDANCGNDFVNDTPPASAANYGCKTFPYNQGSCFGNSTNGEMYMNYMDYCDDACMVMFTAGQKTRMLATLTGTRASLIASGGCNNWPADIASVNNPLQSVSCFPNPVVSELEVQVPNNFIYNYTLINMNGQVVLSKQNVHAVTGVLPIDMNKLPSGVYILQLNNGSNSIVQRVVKQ